MVGTTQGEAKKKFSPTAFDQMESANKWCMFFTLVFSLVSFQMGPFIFFCINYPAVIVDLLTIAVLGTIGQVFIYYTIFNFTSLILSIITTTRKFFTVLASIMFYNHIINGYHWASIALVFGGVGLELYDGATKKHDQKIIKLPPSTIDPIELTSNTLRTKKSHKLK